MRFRKSTVVFQDVGFEDVCELGFEMFAKILDFRGFDSSIILVLRGGIIMSLGNFPASLSQAFLAGRFLVGRLGVYNQRAYKSMSVAVNQETKHYSQ